MGIPLKIKPKDLKDYLEVISKAVFQSGLSWASIDKRWPAFVEAFMDFDPQSVADLSDKEMDRLLKDPSLLLNDRKLKATIHNAKALLEIDTEYGGMVKYFHAFRSYPDLSADLKSRFSYLGDMNVYYFLFRVGETVPPFKSWITTIKGEHPRMKEMVELSKKMEIDEDAGDALNMSRAKKSRSHA
jgi:3-methyladenine DNA glycosylase Tag